ncbi:MAG TPA: IS21 family transposase [Tepidisphaeraceae bacterium]|jgi:transposase|nr:IS21 family transposase [Tepidisphaeraceae bacterium]
MDIQLLFKQLGSIRAVVRETGFSRNTLRRMLRTDTPPTFNKPVRKRGVDDFADYLTRRFTEHGLSAERLPGEIKAQGFTGSIHMVRRFVRKLRPLRVSAATATVRFETPPGTQAQCDWAYCGRHPDRAGRPVSVYAFVMVLGFSRAMFVRFTTSMNLGTLIDCHREAFTFLGGVPAEVLYDNMKQVRLEDGKPDPAFVDFASHHGFAVKTCRVRRPRTKGKVERMVDYVKDNFLLAREFADLEDLNTQARAWLDTTANTRMHATTGHRPADLLASEREHLTPMSSVRPYAFIEKHPRKVAAESMVSFRSSRYSVPPAFVGREVTVELAHEGRTLVIRSGDVIVAEHPPASRPGESVAQKAHLDELWKLAMQRTPTPLPDWKLTFDHAVAVTPLERYEKLIDPRMTGAELNGDQARPMAGMEVLS